MSSLVSSMSLAQGTSVITGTVTDAATGKPVSDVVVTASSPALQGEAVVVTDAAGLYRLAQLPSGVYTLKLEKESYKPFSRPEINVRTDRTVRVNIQVQPESVQSDTIVVVGRPPTVDVGSTTTGINVGKEFINNIAFIQPNASGVRSFESLAAVAPQVSGDQYGYGFSGAQSPENLYLVDGVSTGDPGLGTNGAQFPVEFVEEANVITGGYQAEYGRATGGVLNVVTKSGSNEFHGSVWGNWTPGALSLDPKTIKSDSSAFAFRQKLVNSVDFGATLGGPIIKDKLWFFVGFSPSFVTNNQTRSVSKFKLNDPDPKAATDFLYDTDGYIQREDIPDSTKSRNNDIRAFTYMGKLTFLINSDHNIALSVVGSPDVNVTPNSYGPRFTNWNGGFTNNTLTNTVSLRYQGGFLDKHLLADVSLGWFHTDTSTSYSDNSKVGDPNGLTATGAPGVIYRRTAPYTLAHFEPEYLAACGEDADLLPTKTVLVRGSTRYLSQCPVTGAGSQYVIGGAGFVGSNLSDRYQGRASLTYLMQAAGHHIWKVGLDIEHVRYDLLKAYSGGVLLRENPAGTRFDDYRQYGYFVGPDQAVVQKTVRSVPTSMGIGAYLQDSWQIMDLVTLNAGLRYETQQLFSSGGDLGLTMNNMLSPRVGLIYDFTQQGRSKLFGNYSRFYESLTMDIADRALTGESQFGFRRQQSTGADGFRSGCNPLKDFNQVFNECQDPKNYLEGAGRLPVNRLAGNDYVVNAAGRATGAGKTPVDPNLQPQSSDEIVFGGEYEVINDGRLGATYTKRWINQIIEDMSFDEASTYFIGNPGYGLAGQFPKATRDYDAVTAYFNKSFSDGWMAQASYTWSYLRGNYNGLFRPENGQIDPNINSDFDLISLLANRTGTLDGNHTHAIKVFAAKEFIITGSFGISLGLSYTGRSGNPISYLGAHPLYGANESFVLGRGTGGELPWRHEVDAKLGLSYRINKDNSVQVTADVFNLFNFQSVTSVDQNFSNSSLLPFRAKTNNPQEEACLSGLNNPACKDGQLPIINADTGTNATTADLNPNFKKPTGYQSPLSVRFGVRFTF